MAAPKSTPKDAQVMMAILKDMGIVEYEPRIINQMLEFTYRYVTNILDDARVFCNHAKKKNLDVDDVKLAIQMQLDKSFTTPPPRDILIEIARQRNNIPLPLIRPHCGPRLPPDRYCTTSCNFKLKSSKRPAASRQFQIGMPFGSLTNPKMQMVSAVPKLNPAVNLSSKSGSTLSLVTKSGSAPTVSIVTRPAATTSATPSFPGQPLIKISTGNSMPTTNSSGGTTQISTPSSLPSSAPIIVTRTVPAPILSTGAEASGGIKRKREPDEYD